MAPVLILLGPPGAGRQAHAAMKAGGFDREQIVLAFLQDRRAEARDRLPAAAGRKPAAAIGAEADDPATVARLSGGFAFAVCGAAHHDAFKQPATAGACDKYGGTGMKRRADDDATTVRGRLTACHARTALLVTHDQGNVVPERVEAMGDIADIRKTPAAIVLGVAA